MIPVQPELRAAMAFFAILIVLSVVGYFARKRLQARGLLAFQLLTLLISLFGLLVVGAPHGNFWGWIGALGLVGTFWLMARFENTDRG